MLRVLVKRILPGWTAVAMVGVALAVPEAVSPTPRLVVWITVDQLRADMLAENLERFSPGGFRDLARDGVYYRRATYDHAITFTATGHATLFTGKHPSEHGIIANEWADRGNGQVIACVEDAVERLLGEPTRPQAGASPRNLLVPTVGDVLVRATSGRSRVFSVSFKDRGAILPGGQAGKAIWFSTTTGRFVSSTYYYSQLPAWVERWNQKSPIETWRGGTWDLLLDRPHYWRAGQDDRPYERSLYGLGRTFPHPLPGLGAPTLAAAIACTPLGDELTLGFAEELIRQERLGQGETPDLLAVSFSSTDMVGHIYGPDSLEAEDNLLRLDRLLARLIAVLRREVGGNQFLFVLSSDHGIGLIPESLGPTIPAPPRAGDTASAERAGPGGHPPGGTLSDACCAGGRHDVAVIVAGAEKELRRRFDLHEPVVAAFWTPWLYLNEGAVLRQDKSVAELERALGEYVAALPGVDSAWTRADLAAGRFPPPPLGIWLRHAFHAGRAGHVLLVPKPNWYLYTESHKYAATHGTHYDYDRTVPILACGPGVQPATVDREVHPDALAHAIASRLGLREPDCAPDRCLREIAVP
jgi:predicted AlkP superfamily pyrophosphatase or phosphodiesterase